MLQQLQLHDPRRRRRNDGRVRPARCTHRSRRSRRSQDRRYEPQHAVYQRRRLALIVNARVEGATGECASHSLQLPEYVTIDVRRNLVHFSGLFRSELLRRARSPHTELAHRIARARSTSSSMLFRRMAVARHQPGRDGRAHPRRHAALLARRHRRRRHQARHCRRRHAELSALSFPFCSIPAIGGGLLAVLYLIFRGRARTAFARARHHDCRRSPAAWLPARNAAVRGCVCVWRDCSSRSHRRRSLLEDTSRREHTPYDLSDRDVLAVGTGWLTLTYLSSLRTPSTATAPRADRKPRDSGPGEDHGGDVHQRDAAREHAMQPDAIADPNQAVGSLALITIPAGSQLTASAVGTNVAVCTARSSAARHARRQHSGRPRERRLRPHPARRPRRRHCHPAAEEQRPAAEGGYDLPRRSRAQPSVTRSRIRRRRRRRRADATTVTLEVTPESSRLALVGRRELQPCDSRCARRANRCAPSRSKSSPLPAADAVAGGAADRSADLRVGASLRCAARAGSRSAEHASS